MSEKWTGLPLGGHSPVNSSHLSLLGHLQRIVDFDAEVSDRALDLAVAKQELHGSQILGAPVDQGRFGAAHRVGAILGFVEADLPDPPIKNPGVLSRR